MRQSLIALGVAMILLSASSHAVTPNDFAVETTRDLVKLCKVRPGSDLYNTARAFCLGYLDGVWDYHESLTAGAGFDALACPGADVTRDKAAEVFLDWAKRHSEARERETAVHGVMRAFIDEWPCPAE